MGKTLTELRDLEEQIMQYSLGDYIYWIPKYFWCGNGKQPYYNYSFAFAVEIIGKRFGEKNKSSDYHNGIAYIAKKANVTKSQVKSLRKKMKVKGGYEFKTPFNTSLIVVEMVNLLSSIEETNEVKRLYQMSECSLYRDMLINKQYASICMAALEGRRRKVLELEGSLSSIITEYVVKKND